MSTQLRSLINFLCLVALLFHLKHFFFHFFVSLSSFLTFSLVILTSKKLPRAVVVVAELEVENNQRTHWKMQRDISAAAGKAKSSRRKWEGAVGGFIWIELHGCRPEGVAHVYPSLPSLPLSISRSVSACPFTLQPPLTFCTIFHGLCFVPRAACRVRDLCHTKCKYMSKHASPGADMHKCTRKNYEPNAVRKMHIQLVCIVREQFTLLSCMYIWFTWNYDKAHFFSLSACIENHPYACSHIFI